MSVTVTITVDTPASAAGARSGGAVPVADDAAPPTLQPVTGSAGDAEAGPPPADPGHLGSGTAGSPTGGDTTGAPPEATLVPGDADDAAGAAPAPLDLGELGEPDPPVGEGPGDEPWRP